MNQVTVTVEGIPETITKMTKYSIELTNAIEKANKTWAKRIVKDARSRVPVKTGGLKKSIKARYFKKDGPAATVFPRGKAGSARHLVEYGTGPRTQKSTGRYTGRMPAKPFMGPAEKNAERTYAEAIAALVGKDVTV